MDDWLDQEELEVWEEIAWDEEWDNGRMIWESDMPVHLSKFSEVIDLTSEAS